MSASSVEAPQAGTDDQPQAGTPESPTQPQAGDSTPETISLDEARKLRSEASNLRKRLKAFEDEATKREQTEQTEVERLRTQLAEMGTRVTAAEQKERDYALRDAIAETVGTKDFAHVLAPGVSAAKVLRLLDSEAVEWSERGEPANVRALLAGLLKSDPYLFAQPRVPSGDGGAGRGGAPVTSDMNTIIRQKAAGG